MAECFDDGAFGYFPTYWDYQQKSAEGEYNNWIGVGGSGLAAHYPASYGNYRVQIENNYPYYNVHLSIDVTIYGTFSCGWDTNNLNTYQLKLYIGTSAFSIRQTTQNTGSNVTINGSANAIEGYVLKLEPDKKFTDDGVNRYCGYSNHYNNYDDPFNLGPIETLYNGSTPPSYLYLGALNFYNTAKITHPITISSVALPIPNWENYLNYYPGSILYKNTNEIYDWYSCNRMST